MLNEDLYKIIAYIAMSLKWYTIHFSAFTGDSFISRAEKVNVWPLSKF